MAEKSKPGIIYVLTNRAMPGLVKIGYTTKKDVKKRLKDLYTPGVPLPFDCEYAGEVQNVKKVERVLHKAFKDRRLNDKREFFSIEADQVVELVELLSENSVADVTQEVRDKADAVDPKTQNRFKELVREVRSSLSFADMGIQEGDELHFHADKSIHVVVTDTQRITKRVVGYQGEEVEYTALTEELTGKKNIRPDSYWKYRGELVADIFDRTHNTRDENASPSLFNKQTKSKNATPNVKTPKKGKRKRRDALSLGQMRVRKGDLLYFTQNDSISVKVVDVDKKKERLVEYKGKKCLLQDVTRELRGPNVSSKIRPDTYWKTRDGKTLIELFEEYYK